MKKLLISLLTLLWLAAASDLSKDTKVYYDLSLASM